MRRLAATVAAFLSCTQANGEGADWYCSATFQDSTITMMDHYHVDGEKMRGAYDLLITANNEYGIVASSGYARSNAETQLPMQAEVIANSVMIDKKDGIYMVVASTSNGTHVEVRTGHCLNGGP